MTAPQQQGNETGPDAEGGPTYTCGELYDLTWRAEGEDNIGICPVQVSLGKISVVLRRPARGAIQLDTGRRGKGGRFSTGTDDLQVAIGVAETWLKERQGELLADGKLERVRPDTITVDQAMKILERHRPPKEKPRRLTEFRFVANLARAIWGSQRRVSAIDQMAVERFEHARREKGVTFPDNIEHRPVAPVAAVTAMADLEIINREFGRLTKLQTPDGARYLRENPLSRLNWRGSGEEFKKKRRIPHSRSAFRRLMSPVELDGVVLAAPVDRIDPTGLLRFLVALAFSSARRLAAMRLLKWGNILLTESAIRERLILCADPHLPEWAPYFAEQGAIRWPPETDKGGYDRVFPMPSFLRSELEHYLARLGTTTLPAPHLPVFASPDDPESPISKSTLTKTRYPDPNGNLKAGGWLTEAIFLAREDLRREGKDPDEVFPTRLNERGLERFQFPLVHGFRARWATTMRDLGWGVIDPRTKKLTLDPHVSFLGSWSIQTGDTRQDNYVAFDPEILVAIVEMQSAIEVYRKRSPRVAGKIQRDLTNIGAGRTDG